MRMAQERHDQQVHTQRGVDEVIDWDFALRELASAQGKLILSRTNFSNPKVHLPSALLF
jgi:hypothetical protein